MSCIPDPVIQSMSLHFCATICGCVLLYQSLVGLMMEEDHDTLVACWTALGAVIASIPKELQPSYVRCMREAVQTARDKERRKRRPGPLLLGGFCLPKALQPVLPIYLQGVLQVSAVLLFYVPLCISQRGCLLECVRCGTDTVWSSDLVSLHDP